jgi:hypothetical protein
MTGRSASSKLAVTSEGERETDVVSMRKWLGLEVQTEVLHK